MNINILQKVVLKYVIRDHMSQGMRVVLPRLVEDSQTPSHITLSNCHKGN